MKSWTKDKQYAIFTRRRRCFNRFFWPHRLVNQRETCHHFFCEAKNWCNTRIKKTKSSELILAKFKQSRLLFENTKEIFNNEVKYIHHDVKMQVSEWYFKTKRSKTGNKHSHQWLALASQLKFKVVVNKAHVNFGLTNKTSSRGATPATNSFAGHFWSSSMKMMMGEARTSKRISC